MKLLEGEIKRINRDIVKGTTFYYFTLKQTVGIFNLTSVISKDIILSNPGDLVRFEYENSDMEYLEVEVFENLSLSNN